MSAVVCGKRSLFEDIHGSPPIAKRIRCGGNSPIRFPSVVSPVRIGTAGGAEGRPAVSFLEDNHLSQLRVLFAEMDGPLVERVYESCGRNLDSAIKSLNGLRLSSSEHISPSPESAGHADAAAAAAAVAATSSGNCGVSSDGYAQTGNAQAPSAEAKLSTESVPTEGSEWVAMLVQEMMSAADLEDARMRATRALEAFEKFMASRAGVLLEMMKKENSTLKEQVQGLLRDNHILKRAVSIQHDRQLENEERLRELQNLKNLLAQHQEQLRSLELNNYALSLHLRKAQEGSSIPGRFHPDLF